MSKIDFNNMEDLIKISLILGALIFLGFGFLLGNSYVDKSCSNNPLVYGITRLNEFNQDKFTCTCNSNSGKINPFLFTEDGVIKNIFNKY